MTTKWFFKAQDESSKQLYSMFENCPCVWQMVSKDRVVELYQCSKPQDTEKYPADEWVLMQVVITKQGKSASVTIHQLEYKYGWKVN